MPPRRAVKGCQVRRNVGQQELPNAPEVKPQREITHAEFCETIRMLCQSATHQIDLSKPEKGLSQNQQ